MQLSSLFMVGLPANNDLMFVEELRPSGVILMGRNARPFEQIQELTRQLRELGVSLIASDHEGGRVQRLKEGFTVLPLAREVASGGIENVRATAHLVGRELGNAGINFNFAPVCDVPIHEGDTVIGHRAFSTNFKEAGELASVYCQGLQERVGACAKHFPGHGGVGVDSHFGLPVFPGTVEELEPHLVPFKSTIKSGVSAIMVAHISVPSLDPTNSPASLSQSIATDLLRGELGYEGLVVSDDLEMGALGNIGAGDIAVRALNAGCDLLLFCHSASKVIEAKAAVEAALSDGRLERVRVEEALARIETWKGKFAS